MDSEPGGVTCDSDDVDKVEVSTELTEEQIPVLQVETAPKPITERDILHLPTPHLSYYMFLNIDLTHHTHFTHPALTHSHNVVGTSVFVIALGVSSD